MLIGISVVLLLYVFRGESLGLDDVVMVLEYGLCFICYGIIYMLF